MVSRSIYIRLAATIAAVGFIQQYSLPAHANESAKSLEAKGLRQEALSNDKEALKFYERALESVPPGDFDSKIRLLTNTAIGYLREGKQDQADQKIAETIQTTTHLPPSKSLSENTLLNFGNLTEAINSKTPWSDAKKRALQLKRIDNLMAITEISWKEKKTLVDKQIDPIRVLIINADMPDTLKLLNKLLASPQANAATRLRLKYLIAATQYRSGQKAPLLKLEKEGLDKQNTGEIYVSITNALNWVCEYTGGLSFADRGIKKLEALPHKSKQDHYSLYQLYDAKAGIHANFAQIDQYDAALHASIKALDGVPEYASKQRKSTEFLANKLREQKKTKELAALCKERHIDSAAFSEDWIIDFEKDHLLKK